MWGLQDLGVAYGGRWAVSRLTVALEPGAVTALVGGDGAGKSTALRALVGAVSPTVGTVIAPPAEEIGYLSAGPGVYRDLTVVENLDFAGQAYGVRPEILKPRVEELLERTDLGDARDRLAGKLSGGMRQKLALAMAMVHEPRLLVLDEPTTGVDPVSRAELWRLIARAAAGGATVVVATSYIDEAERAEQVVVLVDGTVLISGPPEEITGSVQGALFSFNHRPQSWRRGASWRVWSSDPTALSDSRVPHPDLEDAVVIGELMRLERLREQREEAWA